MGSCRCIDYEFALVAGIQKWGCQKRAAIISHAACIKLESIAGAISPNVPNHANNRFQDGFGTQTHLVDMMSWEGVVT